MADKEVGELIAVVIAVVMEQVIGVCGEHPSLVVNKVLNKLAW